MGGNDSISDRERLHTLSKLCHCAHYFMAENRIHHRSDLIDLEQVGTAETAAAELQEDLSRARMGAGQRLEASCPPTFQHDRATD